MLWVSGLNLSTVWWTFLCTSGAAHISTTESLPLYDINNSTDNAAGVPTQ